MMTIIATSRVMQPTKKILFWLSVVGGPKLFVNKDNNHNDNNQHYDGQAILPYTKDIEV
jgi:hypothetical protein